MADSGGNNNSTQNNDGNNKDGTRPLGDAPLPADLSNANESSQRKRKRRSGWDVDAPTPAPAPGPGSIAITTPAGFAAPSAGIPSLIVPPPMTAAPVTASALGLLGTIPAVINPIAPPAQKSANRIYVGSINYNLTALDISTLFSAFGPVVNCEMNMDSVTGRSKGFAFLEFASAESAQAAMTMDGFELAGRKVLDLPLSCSALPCTHNGCFAGGE